MKTTSLLVFLLVLHLFLYGAFGARLGKFAMKSATTSHQHPSLENEIILKNDHHQSKLDNNSSEGMIHVKCKDDEDGCTSKGKYRKLITSTTMSTSTAKPIQESLEHGRKRMDTRWSVKAQTTLSSSSPSIPRVPSTAYDLDKHKKVLPPAEYENAMDMTVMDYSPAKRKPPIHN